MLARPFGGLTVHNQIDTIGLVRDYKMLPGTENPGVSLQVRDCLGETLSLVVWGLSEADGAALPELSWVCVQGRVSEYSGKNGVVKQIKLPYLPLDSEPPENHLDFLDCAPISQNELMRRFNRHVERIESEPLRALLHAVFTEQNCHERFLVYPAAHSRHHACRFGLLQHTVEVADIVDSIARCHTQWGRGHLWRDLAVTGALLHDIGKVDELSVQNTRYDQTSAGRLLGHVTLGIMRIQRSAARLLAKRQLTPSLQDQVLHLIASHHGKGEWGAARPPMTPEAALLHYADKMSADLFYYWEAQDNHKTGRDGFVHQYKLDSTFGTARHEVFVQTDTMRDLATNLTPNFPVEGTPRNVFAFSRLSVYAVAAPNAPLGQKLRCYGAVAAGLNALEVGGACEEEIWVETAADAGHFLLRVQGDSMSGDDLRDGDLILVRPQETPESSEILALVADGKPVVKRLVVEEMRIVLHSSNDLYPPAVVEDPDSLRVCGRVVGIVRALSEP